MPLSVLSPVRSIADTPIGNIPLHVHHRLLCNGPCADVRVHPDAWLDAEDAALFTNPALRALADECGTVLAWRGPQPDPAAAARAAHSFLIRHPWDLLRANERFVDRKSVV